MRWTGKIRLVPEKLEEPLHWRKPRMVFVNSMSDLFHEGVPDEYIDEVFAVGCDTGAHVSDSHEETGADAESPPNPRRRGRSYSPVFRASQTVLPPWA